MRQKNLSKSTKKCSKFHRRDSLHERVFEWTVSHAKANAWVFPTSFAVILSAVALPIVLKAEFNFELICTLPSFFLSPGSCFKSAICYIQNSLENTPIALFSSWSRDGKIIHNGKVWGLRSPWSSILRPPKHRLMFFISILSAKEVICPF